MSMDYIWLTDKLKGEYKEVFDKAEIFAGIRNIENDESDEMLMDLLDLLLTAQNEGKPVEKVIGSDVEKFCGSYFSNYTMKKRLMDIPMKTYRLMCWVFVLELIFLLVTVVEDGATLFTASADVSGYLIGIGIGIIVEVLFRVLVEPWMFRWKWLTSGVYYTILLVVMTGMIIGGVRLMQDVTLNLPMLPVLIVSGSYVLIYLVVRSILRYRHHGSIRKEKNPFAKSAKNEFMEDMKEETWKELAKRYEKKNKRLEKRGKQPMTPENYMELLKKESIRGFKIEKVAIAFIALMDLGLVIHTALTETWLDAVMYLVVLLIGQIPAMLIFRLSRKTMKWRDEVLEECEKNGVTIIEYMENRESEALQEGEVKENE